MDQPPTYRSTSHKTTIYEGIERSKAQSWRGGSLHRLSRCWSNGGHHKSKRTSSMDEERDAADSPTPWKPHTLRAPILTSVVALSMLFIVIIEVLKRKSRIDGGIILVRDRTQITRLQSFAYQYLPTLIAVCYSMLWSWIDLDAKRLEPYFQLSRPDGAPAVDSILLHYPFDFVALVPLKAAKRGHWSVWCGGTAMMFVFWAITPLQSAIFATDSLSHSIPTQMTTSMELLPVVEQASLLDGNILKSAYGTMWLDRKLPPFTTEEYALLPFLAGLEQQTSKNETWTLSTRSFTTDLSCAAADTIAHATTYTFSNGKGCSVDQLALPQVDSTKSVIQYIGYHDSPYVDWSLENPNCSKEFSNTFLAIYAIGKTNLSDPGSSYRDFTAMFCEASYFSQAVNATIESLDFSVLSIYPIASRQKIPSSLFNTTAFEYLIGTGMPSVSKPRDYPGTIILEQYPRIAKFKIASPVTSMVGFALGLSNASLSEYSHEGIIQERFKAAHKLLFALAINTVMKPTNNTDNARIGLHTFRMDAVVVVPIFAILVQVFLGAVAALAVGLLYVNWNRPCELIGDPASLADILSIVKQSPELLSLFTGNDVISTRALEQQLRGHKFRLSRVRNKYTQSLRLESLNKHSSVASENPGSSKIVSKPTEAIKPVRPWEMSLPVGVTFTGVLLLSVVVLGILYIRIHQINGLPRPSQNAVIRQILLNYIPTAFATLLEPFWVLLNRLLCILQPFEELRRGKAKSSNSLSIDYTSLPPQLVFFRAIVSKHYLLAAVCSMAILANLLAVSLSGLFQESLQNIDRFTNFTYLLSPRFTDSRLVNLNSALNATTNTYSDHFYVLKTNLSDGTPLPPWISPDYFFVPFQASNVEVNSSSDRFSAVTHGIGAKLDCQQLGPSGGANSMIAGTSSDGHSFTVTDLRVFMDGRNTTCINQSGPLSANQIRAQYLDSSQSVDSSPAGLQAMEMTSTLGRVWNSTFSSAEYTAICSSSFIAGWLRANLSQAFWPSSPTSNNSIAVTPKVESLGHMFMMCRPQLEIAPFQVIVDLNGHILSAERVGAFDEDLKNNLTRSETDLYHQFGDLIIGTEPMSGLHSNTFTFDWLNSFINIMRNSSAATDPSEPVPEYATLAPLVEGIYRRLFAILMGVNTQIFEPAKPDNIISGMTTTSTYREFFSRSMFLIAVTLLSLNLLVALLFYHWRPRKYLPRMPTTIASVISYLNASHALAEMHSDISHHSEEQPTYGFGKYIGIDGEVHIGIEREPLVIPLSLENFHTESSQLVLGAGRAFQRKEEQPTEARAPPGWI